MYFFKGPADHLRRAHGPENHRGSRDIQLILAQVQLVERHQGHESLRQGLSAFVADAVAPQTQHRERVAARGASRQLGKPPYSP